MERSIIRTYAGRVKRVRERHDEEPRSKRRCVGPGETTEKQDDAPSGQTIQSSSSPVRPDHPLPSSDPSDPSTNTPPSSPPPPQPTTSPVKRALPPAFRLLSRKRHAPSRSDANRHVLEEVANVNRPQPKGKKTKSSNLTQLQIDLGSEMRKTCKTCGMDYIPSNAEDAALHKTFHARHTAGLDPRKNRPGFKIGARVWASDAPGRSAESTVGDSVVMVHRKSLAAERCNASAVLSIANAELSAVHIEDGVLWSQIPVPTTTTREHGRGLASSLREDARKGGLVDRFKVYVYMEGSRSVGVCLAERIFEAYRVLDESPAIPQSESNSVAPSSSVSVGDVWCPAMLGISRIWTNRAHRRRGIATRLLECACSTFVYGMKVPKDAVAFSQPSESGKLFAENWFKGCNGWKVYKESQ
ncbi:MAG: hypothetical protein M1816_003858 [Peltula sp. TS41687]|nr:MAG: hypothetical protein M1816_003858 [Peltula sp. TS41687]